MMASNFDDITNALWQVYTKAVIDALTQKSYPFSNFMRRREVSARDGKEVFPNTIVMKGNHEILYLDLDTAEQVQTFVKLLPFFEDEYEGVVNRVKIWPSSGEGVHAVIAGSLPISNPYAWQAILGSDPMREFLNVKERLEGESHAETNILFKPNRCVCGEGYLSKKNPQKCGWCSCG